MWIWILTTGKAFLSDVPQSEWGLVPFKFVLVPYFTFIETICQKIWTKQPPKNARRNFTSDLRPSPKNFVKVSNVPYISCLHYQKLECENLPLSFLRLYSVVCFLVISLDSIKFAPQGVEEDQDLKRLNKEYHTTFANIRRSAWKITKRVL